MIDQKFQQIQIPCALFYALYKFGNPQRSDKHALLKKQKNI